DARDALGLRTMQVWLRTFSVHTALGAALCLVWFALPGFAVLRTLRLTPAASHDRRIPSIALLLAPALGLGTFASFSLAFCRLSGYSRWTLLLAWAVLLGGAFALGRDGRSRPGNGHS